MDFIFEKEIGKVVSKTSKIMRDGSDIHPKFQLKYNEALHSNELNSRLKLDPNMDPRLKQRLLALIKKYFCVFAKENVHVPINDYQCHIDTGDAQPVVAKGIRFGMHETPIIQAAIDGLLQKNQVTPDTESQWLSRPVLAPKPHQEDKTIEDIDSFEWRFCISYIPLNRVTKLVPYPIPRCDDATEMHIGKASFRILMDAFSGYHQIKMSHQASLRSAFAGPGGRKYRYLVMPFGVVNGPVFCVWDNLASQMGVVLDSHTNSVIIIDDTFIFQTMKTLSLTTWSVYWKYQRDIIYHGSWKNVNSLVKDLNLLAQILLCMETSLLNQNLLCLRCGNQKDQLPSEILHLLLVLWDIIEIGSLILNKEYHQSEP